MNWEDIIAGIGFVVAGLVLLLNIDNKVVGDPDINKQIIRKDGGFYIIAPMVILSGIFLILKGILKF